MFKNIGKKLKSLATAIFVIMTIVSIGGGIGIIASEILDEFWFIAIPLIFFGIFLGWVTAAFIYGFGELVDKTCDIAQNTNSSNKQS